MYRLTGIVFLLFATPLFSQPYYIKNWGPEDGLPQSQVFSLLNDSKGYLWAGTYGGGLPRFDGENFVNYSSAHGLEGQFILALIESVNGDIIAGTDKGVSVFNGRDFRNYSGSRNGQRLQVNSLCYQGDSLWIGTNKGLYIYYLSRITEPFPDAIGDKYIFSVWADPGGEVWIGTDGALFKSTPQQELKKYGPPDGLTFPYVRHVTKLPDGTLFVATYGGGVYQFENEHFHSLPVPVPLALYLSPDGAGKLWIATLNKGLAHWSPADSTWFFISENEGLSNNHIRSLLPDREGNLWIGT